MYDIIIMVNNMNSRMERYKSTTLDDTCNDNKAISRVSRNNSLYQDIKSNELSRVRSNDNIKVIDNNGKTINLDKIKRYISEANEQPTRVRKTVITTLDEVDNNDQVEDVLPKNYDINSVLENAKKTREIDYDRERYKKLRDTQYDILSKIEMYDNKEETKEELEEEFNTDERTLIDLINTVTIHKGDVNLLEELIGDEDEERTDPIDKEVEKGEIKNEIIKELEEKKEEKQDQFTKTQELTQLKTTKIDNSFYTNSMSFSKEDFEGFDELEKSVKKNGIFSSIMIVVLIIFVLVTLVIMANYVFDLGLF